MPRDLLTRLLVAWSILAVAMTANGVFREAVLKRLVAPSTADALSAATGILLILLVTRLGFSARVATATPVELWLSTAMLVGMTVAFEFVVGRFVDHRSWSELLANYQFWNGRLWPLVLLVLASTPFLWGRPPWGQAP